MNTNDRVFEGKENKLKELEEVHCASIDPKLVAKDLAEILRDINKQKTKLSAILESVKPTDTSTAETHNEIEEETVPRNTINEMIKKEQVDSNNRLKDLNTALTKLREHFIELEEELDHEDTDLASKALCEEAGVKKHNHRRYISDIPKNSKELHVKKPLLTVPDPLKLSQKETCTQTEERRQLIDSKSREHCGICSACSIF